MADGVDAGALVKVGGGQNLLISVGGESAGSVVAIERDALRLSPKPGTFAASTCSWSRSLSRMGSESLAVDILGGNDEGVTGLSGKLEDWEDVLKGGDLLLAE